MTTLVFVLAFIIVALFVYMARYSGRLRVEQKRLIAAPLAEVYAKVADFRAWGEWSPWLEHEPAVPVSISGVPDGKGGCYAWDSARIGSGEIEHREMVAGQRIEQRIRAVQPFRFHGKATWKFVERDGQTEVTWAFRGRVGFSLRAFAQTVQGMIALDYRYGLDKLARLLEPSGDAAQHYAIEYVGQRDVAATRYVYRTYSGPLKGIGKAMREGFAALSSELAAAGGQAAGEPIAVYVKTNIKLRTTVCHMGIPIADADFDRLPVRDMPAHCAYVVRLTGTYEALEIAWYEAMQRVRIENFQPEQRIPPFERYLNDPSSVPEQAWVTELHIPLRA
jgi:hypothetical protein